MKKLALLFPVIILITVNLLIANYYQPEKSLGAKDNLLVPTEDILFYDNVSFVSTSTVYYYFKSDKTVQISTLSGSIKISSSTTVNVSSLPEVSRDYNRIDYRYDKDTIISEFYGGVPFVKDTISGLWYEVGFATTTYQNYIQKTASATPIISEYIFGIKPALAVSSTIYPFDDRTNYVANANFTTAHDATTGTLQGDAGLQYVMCRYFVAAGGYDIWRFFLTLDTSAIGDTDTIDSATFSIYGNAKGGGQPYAYNVYNSAHTNTVAAGDYDLCGTTAYSTQISQASFSTSGYNDYALNASGLSGINKSGYTKFCFREATKDAANVAPTVDDNEYIEINSVNQTGTAKDPKLVVVHSSSTPAVSGIYSNIINFD